MCLYLGVSGRQMYSFKREKLGLCFCELPKLPVSARKWPPWPCPRRSAQPRQQACWELRSAGKYPEIMILPERNLMATWRKGSFIMGTLCFTKFSSLFFLIGNSLMVKEKISLAPDGILPCFSMSFYLNPRKLRYPYLKSSLGHWGLN